MATAAVPPSSRRRAEVPGSTWHGGGAIVRAEHDNVGVLIGGEPGEPFAGRGAEDDPAGDVEVVEPARAALEQGLGLGLVELLARAVGLSGVTHVGEFELSSGGREDAAKGQGVVIVECVVVRDDGLGAHWFAPSESSGVSITKYRVGG
jgi:hypothetical protein